MCLPLPPPQNRLQWGDVRARTRALQLGALFNAPFASDEDRDQQVALAASMGEPLLHLHTGARVSLLLAATGGASLEALLRTPIALSWHRLADPEEQEQPGAAGGGGDGDRGGGDGVRDPPALFVHSRDTISIVRRRSRAATHPV